MDLVLPEVAKHDFNTILLDVGDGFEGGNISDLGGYYNELVYFTDCAKQGKPVEQATICDGVDSLCFVLEEIKNA